MTMQDQDTQSEQYDNLDANEQSGVQRMKAMLFEELENIVRTSRKLMERIQAEEWSYRPQQRDNMNTVQELVCHLAAIPSTDLLILQEHTEAEVVKLEDEYRALGTDANKLGERMSAGLESLRSYMEALPDEEFLSRRTTPFYIDHPTAQAKWLIEITTHLQHHRAQLFNYLKELGHPVNMFDLY